MALKPEQLHFLMVPLPSQSHIIPLTDFSKLLAEKGISVSIVTTPLNEIRYRKVIDNARARNLRIQTIPIEFPGPKLGLPENCQNLDSLESMDLMKSFFQACEMLQQPLESLIQNLEPKPNCIISTTTISWTQQVADKFNIPRYVFETLSCFTLSCINIIAETKIQDSVNADSDPFLIPNIPHGVEITKAQLPNFSGKHSESNNELADAINRARASSRGTIVNSFEELEPWYLQNCRERRGKVYSIGPVSLSNRDSSERFERGNQVSIEEKFCMNWLNSREEKSVLYACFGSLSRLKFEQIREIGLGLEKSNFPFIWIIRNVDITEEVKNWIEGEAGFESRIKNRGLIIRGWAPQFLILSHPSIGGFLTHCGWNSTLESISAGVPMMTWPMFAEQFYNEKLIVDVLRIGVRFGVKNCMNHENNVLIRSDEVRSGIQNLMDGQSVEGVERRRRARELAKMGSKALEKHGSSSLNLDMFIQDVMQHVVE